MQLTKHHPKNQVDSLCESLSDGGLWRRTLSPYLSIGVWTLNNVRHMFNW